jgi:hypothetical protein
MRRALIVALVTAGCLLWIGTVRAGLYNPAEPPLPLKRDLKYVLDTVGKLRILGMAPKDRPKPAAEKPAPAAPQKGQEGDLSPTRYEEQVEKLRAKQQGEGLTVTEQISLGAYLLRLQRTDEALRVLSAAEAEEPDNYQVLANLATAYLMLFPNDPEQLRRAIEYQEKALAAWPEVVPDQPRARLLFWRRVEEHQLTLLRSRQQDLVRRGNAAIQQTVDPVFPGVRFEGAKGEYLPGDVAGKYSCLLPPDDLDIVMQMVFWLPYDNYLYWLLGEVANAHGDIPFAAKILDKVVYNGLTRVPELKEHWGMLRAAERALQELQNDPKYRAWGYQVFWLAMPRPGSPTPATGPGSEAVQLFVIDRALHEQAANPLSAGQSFPQPPAPPPANPDTAPTSTILQTLWYGGIGFAFGVLFALILRQQFRPRGSNKVPAAPTPG